MEATDAKGTTSTQPVLTEEDTRAMVRLLGIVAADTRPLAKRRTSLMEGLSRLIDADAWVWTLMGQTQPGVIPTFTVFLRGGMTDQQLAGHLSANEHPDMARIQEPFYAELQEKGTHITRLRQQVISDEDFHSADVAKLWKQVDLGPVILSYRPTSEGKVSGIVLFRNFDREPFSPRESRIAHILLSEVPWLHDDAWPGHSAEEIMKISPRLNTVLSLLLQGFGRKQIAGDLGISIHTLNDYIKTLYRRFNVHSQSELIRRFVEGDGNDVPLQMGEA